jgi:hypothetical protein
MGDPFRFHKLREMAIKEQYGSLSNLPSGEDGNRLVAEYVLVSGTEKGQTSMAFTAHGGGTSVQASFNPLGIFGINLGISAAGGFDITKQRSVLVTVGPRYFTHFGTQYRQNHQPFLINSFVGHSKKASFELGLEVSLGYTFSAGGFGGRRVSENEETRQKSVDRWGWQSKGESANQFRPQDEPPDESVMFELNCLGFEAKTGLSATGSIEGEWYYAEDPLPVQFDGRNDLINQLAETLKEGDTKTVLKAKAYQFFNDYKHYFNDQERSLHSSFWGMNFTEGFRETLRILDKYAPGITDPDHRAIVDELKEKLERFGRPSAGDSFLSVHTMMSECKLGAFASTSATLFPIGDVTFSANALAGISGSYKKSKTRFQTYWYVPTSQGTRQRRVTYDTIIRYSTFSAGLHAEISAGNKYTRRQIRGSDNTRDVVDDGYGRIYGQRTANPMIPDVNRGFQKLNKAAEDFSGHARAEPESLNRMSYETAIIYWVKPFLDGHRLEPGVTYDAHTNPVQGTGIAVGQSFVIKNLRKIAERHTGILDLGHGGHGIAVRPSFHKDDYVKLIAQSLRVSTWDLQTFFGSPETHLYLSQDGGLPEDMSVLLEACFRANVGTSIHDAFPLPAKVKIDRYGNQVVQLDLDVGKKLERANLQVESIRLRYRKFDLNQKQRNLFSLGFKFFGNELQVKLRSVSSAGSDGIIDLCTVFMDPNMRALHGRDPAAAYEQAVPAAVLFCQ